MPVTRKVFDQTTKNLATSLFNVKEAMIILHAGAKAKGIVVKDRIPDPEGLISWLGNDRGQIVFKDMADIKSKQGALKAIVGVWIELI